MKPLNLLFLVIIGGALAVAVVVLWLAQEDRHAAQCAANLKKALDPTPSYVQVYEARMAAVAAQHDNLWWGCTSGFAEFQYDYATGELATASSCTAAAVLTNDAVGWLQRAAGQGYAPAVELLQKLPVQP